MKSAATLLNVLTPFLLSAPVILLATLYEGAEMILGDAPVPWGELALGIFPVTPAPPQPIFPPASPVTISQKVKSG